jgi:Ig-like domain CHU_C associated
MARLAGLVVGMLFLAHATAAQFTQQGSKLVGTGAFGSALQGASVAISADGNTAIVGGPADNSNAGAAWVFTRSGGVWSQQGNKLVGTGAVVVANYVVQQGASVAVSADGNTAIVGGPGDNSNNGAAWVFTRSGGVWSQQGNKLVGAGADWPARQGYSVAISADGTTAIVGGPNDDGDGAAWVFTRSGGVWFQEGDKLVGTGSDTGLFLGAAQGWSVSISADGNTAVVGGWGDRGGAGAAWVFTRSGGVWSQQGSKLVSSGTMGVKYQDGSAAISGDGNTVIVGGQLLDGAAFGATWVLTHSGGVWSQQATKLVGTGAVGASYPGSVAISADGNTAIVSGSGDSDNVGATWVFTRSGGAWSQQGSKLVGAGAVGAAQQGQSVAIAADGATAIIGGGGDNSGVGAAWVFVAGGCTSPSITSQPQSQSVQTGQTATLSVTATGTAPFSYQWYQGVSGDASNLVGTDASSFTTPVLTSPTSFWVRVSNSCGHADSATALITLGPAFAYLTWVPVASHTSGLNNSQWRSDLGLLNIGAVTANVQIRFYGTGGLVGTTTYVPPGAQSVLTDVVGQLGASGSGAVEILSDQALRVTTRTYNQLPSDASCFPNGTQGQDYPAVASGDGLGAGQSAYLAGLREDAAYRCNIGLVNTGTASATALVELYNGAGTKLGGYPVALAAGQWVQATQPFLNVAGQTAMDRGYAKITVQSGSGLFAFASVIDNITNDPTLVTMQR